MSKDYSDLATRFYDITKPIDGDYPDVPYYQEVLGNKKHRILEIGAGTGRLCLPLLMQGYKMEALECSKPMLSTLKKNLQKYKLQMPIHALRAEEMKFSQDFDVIVISFGTFQMFSELAEAQYCLALCKRALRKGGRLFVDLDIIRPELHKAGMKSYGVSVPLATGENIVLEGSRAWDFVKQTEMVHLRYELWKGAELKKTELQDFSLRWYGLWEFEALLKSCGFEQVETMADYFEPEAHADTQTINFVAV